MSVYIKVKLAQARLAKKRAIRKAKKLCLAVVIIQFLLASGYCAIVKADLLKPSIVYINIVRAEKAPIKEDSKPEISDIDRIADYIYTMESSRGKNNFSKCEAIGKVNNIGFGIWGDNWLCFDSHAEEMETVKKWIKDKQDKGMSEKDLLCLYSGGNYKICK
jgi:hypothetical protein